MGGPDWTYDPAEASHRALRGIQHELGRHPIVTDVRGFPTGELTRVVAALATERWGADRDDAALTVRWFAGATADAAPEFSFHYSDEASDSGWHHEPNPHVEGWGHYQEWNATTEEYTYDSYTFGSANPTRVVWEVMSSLSAELDAD